LTVYIPMSSVSVWARRGGSFEAGRVGHKITTWGVLAFAIIGLANSGNGTKPKASSGSVPTATQTTTGTTRSATTTTEAATTTQRSRTSCRHVSVTALKAIASGLNEGIKLTTIGASAVKIDKRLYSVSARLLGPGMSVGGPSYATWITDSATSPVVVMSGDPFATHFSVWPKSPYYGAGEPAVQTSRDCASRAQD
jgi:hypothetical protein